MKSVAICGSAKRAKKEIEEFVTQLRKRGVIVFPPVLLIAEENEWEKLSPDIKKAACVGLTLDHFFNQIKKADVCFIYNKDGYIGNSVTMEITCAFIMGKPTFAKEPDLAEPFRAVLINEIVPDVDTLILKLL